MDLFKWIYDETIAILTEHEGLKTRLKNNEAL